MRPQSAKAKGRRAQQEVRDGLLKTFSAQLQADDIRSTPMGSPGEDLLLSPAARECWPYYTEIKNVERLNIHEAIAQASGKGREPCVVFRKNSTRLYAVVAFDELMALRLKAYGYDHP